MLNNIADTIAIDQIVDETEPFDSVHQHAGPIDCYEASGENSVQDLPVNDTLADLNLTHETKLTTPELVQSELQSPSKENIGKYFRNYMILADTKAD